MSGEQKLQFLIAKRENTFRKLQLIYDALRAARADTEKISIFTSRYAHIERVYDDFKTLEDEINILKLELEPNKPIDFKTLEAFEEIYFRIKADCESVIPPEQNEKSIIKTSEQTAQPKIEKPRLPKIELPHFDSSISQWSFFFDQFQHLIHSRTDISQSSKFHYLVSSISGPALSIVKSLPVSDSNYSIVWDALVNKYQNKRALATDIVDKLFNFIPMSIENSKNLYAFLSVFQESVASLKALNIDNLDDFLLLYTALKCLPYETRKQFERHHLHEEIPRFDQLIKYVENQARVLEVSHIKSGPSSSPFSKFVSKGMSHPSKQIQQRNPQVYHITRSPSREMRPFKLTYCVLCNQQHSIYQCPELLKVDDSLRIQRVKSSKLCINCLKGNHSLENCSSKTSCFKCGLRHHTLLHPSSTNQTSNVSSHHVSFKASASDKSNNARVLLGTALVRIQDGNGEYQLVRTLIDPGAQVSFVTSSCAKRLKLKIDKCNIPVYGLGLSQVENVQGKTTCSIKPRTSDEPTFTTEAVVLHNITSYLPSQDLPVSIQHKFQDLPLADPGYHRKSNVDLLIAADLFPFIFTGPKILGCPSAFDTVFGWVVMGPLQDSTNSTTKLCPPLNHVNMEDVSTNESDLNLLLKSFWESEEPPNTLTRLGPAEQQCEEIFSSLYYRDKEGRYVVPLPFASAATRNFSRRSYHHALACLISMERRFARQPDLKELYVEFLEDYEKLGHMTKVSRPLSTNLTDLYYIPHHPVFKPDSSSTKLRVVFNGSCRSSNQPSLNQLLLPGPKLQSDIVNIICRFRLHRFVFTADISKMYRQILIRPEDRQVQRILWRRAPEEPVSEYELNTITYGLTSSPYLALRTLQQLAQDEGHRFPQAALSLCSDIYIDDLLCGSSSLSNTIELRNQMINLLQSGGFELRKWCSNEPAIINDIPEQYHQQPLSFDPEGHSIIKVLGMQWNSQTDSFSYSIHPTEPRFTKRSILSQIARMYDPLGWLTPVIFKPKCLMQQLWRLGVGWDEPLPDAIFKKWNHYCKDLPSLSRINIPRWIYAQTDGEYYLVGFSDASSSGYSACVFFVCHEEERCCTHLLMGKSKVAPIKPVSIPRLELCGALLLSQIIKFLCATLNDYVTFTKIIAYSDSTTVLSWLSTDPHLLKQYVATRVSSILDCVTPYSWHYVPSKENPADCASRGLDPSQLVNQQLWWKGPYWLQLPPTEWPMSKPRLQVHDLPETKTINTITSYTAAISAPKWELISKVSSYSKLLRVTAWCLRFTSNLKLPVERRNFQSLTCAELTDALHVLIKTVQREHYSREINNLSNGDQVTSSTLLRLHPFLDSLGLLRVGGRLRNAPSPDNVTPWILPKTSHLSILLIDYYHLKYLHLGPRALQSLLCRKFWIISVRNLIRSRLAKCLVCFKYNATFTPPFMGDLPTARVSQAWPFKRVAIDYGGPFLYKTNRLRNAPRLKCYVSLFVCLTTKAVHLEIVSDLTTNAFLAALGRFIARRGLCSDMYSDCATNFIGARNYLKELYRFLQLSQDDISNYLSQNQINWHLAPPHAPHFNGISEAGIKSVKHHLRKVVGEQILTFEEYYTMFTQIEAILNSRPLCALSSDPHEFDVLTPGHFLIGTPLLALPEVNNSSANLKCLERWQLIQKCRKDFWKRWSRDYLHTLQQRAKWYQSAPNLQKGDLVLVIEDHTPSLHWPIARILDTHPGPDHIVRVVTIRTAKGIYKRAVVKLCPLPNP